jgi:hypothetical protein
MCESEPHVAVFLKDYAKAGKGEIPCRNSTPSPPVVPPCVRSAVSSQHMKNETATPKSVSRTLQGIALILSGLITVVLVYAASFGY